MKPSIVVFSSKQLIKIAEAVRENLRREFEVTPWTEGFFRSNELSLNSFLKQLLCFDGAAVLLGADDVRVSDAGGQVMVPRDNVVFELGACMARFGTQKTFIVCPEKPPVVLPTYFKGFYPLTYEDRADGNLVAATGAACVSIRTQFEQMDRDAYASDLPAQGLAIGYFNNFVHPAYRRLREGGHLNAGVEWQGGAGWELNVVMPAGKFMNRDAVDRHFIGRKLIKCALDLNDGRNISVYVQPRTERTQPLRVFDIPTTLLTSQKVIDKVDRFWGGGHQSFRERLTEREIASFRRAIEELVAEADLPHPPDAPPTAVVRVVEVENLDAELARPL